MRAARPPTPAILRTRLAGRSRPKAQRLPPQLARGGSIQGSAADPEGCEAPRRAPPPPDRQIERPGDDGERVAHWRRAFVIGGDQPAAGERRPDLRPDSQALHQVERAVIEWIEVERRELDLVGDDRRLEARCEQLELARAEIRDADVFHLPAATAWSSARAVSSAFISGSGRWTRRRSTVSRPRLSSDESRAAVMWSCSGRSASGGSRAAAHSCCRCRPW